MMPNTLNIKNLEILYTQIHSEGIKALRSGTEAIDPYLQQQSDDQRRGMALIVNLDGLISKGYNLLVNDLKAVEPGQYYYPQTDIHMTVLDLISASPQFSMNEIMLNKVIEIIHSSVNHVAAFEIEFHGIILSNGAILIKGYYHEGLSEIRNNIRRFAALSGFDLKERYQSISAHVTIARFKAQVENCEGFIQKIEDYRDFQVGVVRVNQMELVIHDWYNSQKNEIQKFILKK
jgi:2'-5' RNA ligase